MAPSWPSRELLLRAVLRRTFPLWERLGLHVVPNHYSQPIPDTRALGERPWARPSELVGIAMNEPAQLALLASFAARFRDEYTRFPLHGSGRPGEYFLLNSMFIGVDGAVLHCMVRHFRPRRVVEVGSGFSTAVSAAALLANARETSVLGELIAIEPQPRPELRAGLPGLTRLVDTPVQALPFSFFDALDDGDVLFIDSSHVLTIGSDVQHLFLEVLPRLRRGVLVHVHDIFLPDE